LREDIVFPGSNDSHGRHIYDLYRFRWVIELIFKDLKGDYKLGKMFLRNEPMAFIHIYSMLLRFIISRDLFA
jgi:IS4 transposase